MKSVGLSIIINKTRIIKALIITLFPILISCGPQFSTEYLYTPPTSESGTNCIFQCERLKQQCIQIEELQQSRCENDAYSEQMRCESDVRYREGREPKWYECGKESCTVNTDRCDSDYRSCYQSCGGKVRIETRCVSNCEQLQPAPQKNSPQIY